MQIIQTDLFNVRESFTLAHCISGDYKMGAGIAKEFTRRGVKAYLQTYHKADFQRKSEWQGSGYAIFTPVKGYNGVFNLVTKERYFHKPTYATLRQALKDMRKQCEERRVTSLAMPQIACGLDKLDWQKVSDIIDEVFLDTDINIVICIPYLDK